MATDAEIPHERITDPRALKAVSHPLRIKMLELIAIAGSITATELSEEVGESPANCSWHLRQLQRAGYIEPAEGGKGRQRPWQLVVTSRSYGGSDESEELAEASDAHSLMTAEYEYNVLRNWTLRRRSQAAEWQDAACVNQSILFLTAEELTDFSRELQELVMRYVHFERIDPGKRPPDAKLIRSFAWAVPG